MPTFALYLPMHLMRVIVVLAVGCTSSVELSTATGEVQGSADITGCSSHVAMIERALHLGRIASQSTAFSQCLDARIAGYAACRTDPAAFLTATAAQRTQLMVELARTDNAIDISCITFTGVDPPWGSSPADTNVAPTERETVRLGNAFLQDQAAIAAQPLWHPGDPVATHRQAYSPWSVIAAVAWHESAHNHGYNHDDTHPDHLFNCTGGDSATNRELSVPYIIDQCIETALFTAGRECGETTCGIAGIEMFENGTCTCIEDPGPACWDNTDSDGDGTGDRCDACPASSSTTDSDGDMRLDDCDNCLAVANSSQRDTDTDGVGNACDNCSTRANPGQDDLDHDDHGDACDNCIAAWNSGQRDTDGDSFGDACDLDIDNDKIPNGLDHCPYVKSSNNADADGDYLGDVCDFCDLVRNVTTGCKPLNHQMRLSLDDRLDAIVDELRRVFPGGPWGPWEPFAACMWNCDANPARHAARANAARTWMQANPGKVPTDAVMRQLLRGEEGATAAAVDQFLSERLRSQL